MSVYLWELSWDNVQVTAGSPDATWDSTVPLAASAMEASFVRGSAQTFTVQVDLWAHSFGGGPTYELVTQQSDAWNTSPTFFNRLALGSFARSHVEANGQNGAAFKTGALTVSLSIDDVAHTITASGPLGTFTYSFVAVGLTNGTITSPALSQIELLVHSPKSGMDWVVQASFFNFYLSKDGVRVAGAQMGSVQPGHWTAAPWNLSSLDAGTGSVITGQTASRQVGGLNYDHTLHVYGNPTIAAAWNRTGTQLADVDPVIAALCDDQEGSLTYARVVKQHVDAVEVGYSDDSAHTWTTVLVGEAAGRVYDSPSLAQGPEASLNLFAFDRSTAQTRWFKSVTRGRTWLDAGFLLSVLPWATSTHPKVLTLSNGFFVVSYNRAGHWFIAVYDGGTGASFGVQTTDLGANIGGLDAFPGLFQTPLGTVSAVQSYSVLNETLEQSADLGVTWTNVYSNPLGTLRVAAVRNDFSAFVWKAWQDAGGNILAAGSGNAGQAYIQSPTTVFASAAAQIVGLTVLPKGYPLVLFQTYIPATDLWTVSGYFSADLGASWIAS